MAERVAMTSFDDMRIEPVPMEAKERSRADGERDLAAVFDNATQGVYADWPNEGGVSGLHYYR